jgi:gas vesicle protein
MIENIQNTQIERAKMASVATRPNSTGLYGTTAMTSAQLKERMDALPLLAVEKVNELINYIKTSDFASDIKINEGTSLSAFATKLLSDIESGALSEYLMVKSGDETVTLDHKLVTIMSEIATLTDISAQLKEASKATSERLDNISESIKSDIAAEIEGALDELEEYANNLYGGEDNG